MNLIKKHSYRNPLYIVGNQIHKESTKLILVTVEDFVTVESFGDETTEPEFKI